MIYYITKQEALFADNQRIIRQDNYDLIDQFLVTQPTAVDTETTGLDAITERPVLLQIGNDVDQFVIDLTTTKVSDKVRNYLESDKAKKILHNAKFDYKMLKYNKIAEMANIYCTQSSEQILLAGLLHSKTPPSLVDLVQKYLNFTMSKEVRSNFGRGKLTNTNFNEAEIVYAANDVKYLYQMSGLQYPMLMQYNLGKVVDLESEALLGYADMELNGIRLDVDKWTEIFKQNLTKVNEFEAKLDSYVSTHPKGKLVVGQKLNVQLDLFDDVRDTRINWSSPAQVLHVVNGLTNLNLPSTNGNELEKFVEEDHKTGLFEALVPEYKIIELLMNYRVYKKACTQYGTKFLTHIHPTTGRIHCNFNPLGTETGRASCDKPNLQNIKAEADYRSCFVPREGFSMLTADFSGCELRIIAEFSQDPVWIDAFLKEEDVHSRVATLLFKKEVTKSNENKHLRNAAKSLNFGLAYGMGPDKLGRKLRIPKKEAEDLMNTFFKEFPKIKKYLDNNGNYAVKYGLSYTPAPYNRIRWYGDYKEAPHDFKVRGEIERAGKNSPIQGCNGDLVKIAMNLIRRYIKREGLTDSVFMVNQVHDEILIEFKSELVDKIKKDIKFLMEMSANEILSKVPMVAEVSVSDCWQK